MENYKKFEEAFEAHLETLDYGLYDFLEYTDDLPFGGEVVSDERDDISDSYDYTNDVLTRVIYFKEFDIYIQFNGTEASYVGLEWDDYKEVKPTTKTITSYE